MSFRPDEQPLLTVGPFIGLDATSDPYYVDPKFAISASNFYTNSSFKGFDIVQGRSAGAQLPGPVVGNMFKFSTVQVGPFPEGFYAYCHDPVLGYIVVWYPAFNSTSVTATPGTSTVPTSVSFAKSQQWTFFSNGVDATFQLPDFVTVGNSYPWGIIAPTVAPALTPSNGGGLTLGGSYSYLVTFEDTTLGEESSAGPATPFLTLTGTQGTITLSGIPVNVEPGLPTPIFVNIYRIGGSQSQYQFIGQVPNGTTTYVDTEPDNQITGQDLVQFRDPAKPFTDIVFYQDRIWGLGYNSSDPNTMSDIPYSNYREPWAFNFADNVIFCGENVNLDPIVGGAALPMMLFVLKRQTAWGIFGTSPSDYVPLPLFPLGCVSKYTIASGYGLVFWLSPDGVVYAFDGTGPQNLSDESKSGSSVKALLQSFTLTDYKAATGFVSDRAYFLSFPTKNITLGYSLITQAWFQLGFSTPTSVFDLSQNNEAIGTTATGQLVQWFTGGGSDLGNPISATYTSGFLDSEAPSITKQYRHLIIYSETPSGIANVTLNVRGTQGLVTYTATIMLNGNETTVSLPATLEGTKLQVSINVMSSTNVLVSKVVVYGYMKRQLNER